MATFSPFQRSDLKSLKNEAQITCRGVETCREQRRLLSDWLIFLPVLRLFHARAREITNKMAAKDVLFDYLF